MAVDKLTEEKVCRGKREVIRPKMLNLKILKTRKFVESR